MYFVSQCTCIPCSSYLCEIYTIIADMLYFCWRSSTLCVNKCHTISYNSSRLCETQGWKKNVARPGLEPRVSCLPCEHSYHWATEPHGQPVTISPCLIRFVPESARNHAGTNETVPLLLAAEARTNTEPPNVTGLKKSGPTGTRTQGLSLTERAL